MKRKIPPRRSLATLAKGESAVIAETPRDNERLAELGIIRGQTVTLLNVAPFGDPVVLQVLDSSIMVRRADIAGVSVE